MPNTTELLHQEITSILSNTATKPRRKEIVLILHTKELDFYINYFISLEIYQDFINNISDQYLITFKIPLGDFVKFIYPYKDNLEMTIITDDTPRRHKLVLYSDVANIEMYLHRTLEDLNKLELIEIEGQCLDRVIELLRTKTDVGIYRDVTPMDVIQHTVLNNIKDIKIDGEKVDCKVTYTTPHNKRSYSHITIPNGTKVIDIPTYIQNTDYGVYNGDIGMYYQQIQKERIYGKGDGVESHLFVYPLTNTDSVKNDLRRLELYKLPHTLLHIIDNSFVIDDKVIKMVIDVASDSIDTGDKEYMNYGESFNVSEVNKVMNRPHTAIRGETPEINFDKYNYNIASKSRDDTISLSRTIKPTDNLYKERSMVLKSLGSMLKFTWRSADIDYLYPGMRVVYTYTDAFDNVITYNGVLQHVYNKIDHNFESIAMLTVYMVLDK